MADSDILEKVRALLALAERASEHESRAAFARAVAIMEKHRISEAEVRAHARNQDGETIETEVLYESPREILWKSILANAVARENRCKMWINEDPEDGIVSAMVLGRRTNVLAAKAMFAWIAATCVRLSQRQDPPEDGETSKRRWRRDYREGFAVGVAKQIELARRVVTRGAPAAALLVLERSDQVLEKAFDELESESTEGRYKPRKRKASFLDGIAEGERLHLGESLDGPSKKVLGP